MANLNPVIPKCIKIEEEYKDTRRDLTRKLFDLRVKLNDKELGKEERKAIIDQINLVRGEIAEVTKSSLQEVKNNELGGMKK